MQKIICASCLAITMMIGDGVATAQQPQQPISRPAAPRPQTAVPAPASPTAQNAAPAQSPTPAAQAAQAAQTTSPQRTTATYDDWIVQCESQAGPPARKVCEMTQVTQLQVQGKSQPFSRVIVPHPAKDQPSTLIIQVPVNVSFATSARIQNSESDQGISAPFARCIPDGCFADFELKDETLKKFRAGNSAGKLSFADSGGHVLSIPLSFNGFGKAYDALARE
jgi:invasion protein IalB